MMSASSKPLAFAQTLRVLAQVLSYPDASRRAAMPELAMVLEAEAALSPRAAGKVLGLMAAIGNGEPLEVEAAYVEVFDRGRSTCLHLFEHVHGDSRDRGPAMIDLLQTYEQQGLFLGDNELPDYLPVVLEFASTLDARQARAFIGEFAHILNAIHTALVKRAAPHACVISSLLELAGEPVQQVQLAEEVPIDETWAEPEPFGGCSSQGQSRPNMPKPIQVIRRNGQFPIGETK